MLLELVAARKVLFVGGKGGTGKTSISSALALARARRGGRVLLVSTDPAHNLSDVWQQQLSDSCTRVFTAGIGRVDAVEVDPQQTIDRHFATVEATMLRMLPEEQHPSVKRHLATAREAPGSQEAAVLERVSMILEDGVDTYDNIVFDTAPTGHTVHLLALPRRLTSWAESLLANRDRSERFAAAARSLVSPHSRASTPDADLRRSLLARRDRFALMERTIADKDLSGFVVVTIAERLPTAESLHLVRRLESLGIDPAALVVNRRSPADAGRFMADKRASESIHVDELRANLTGIPLVEVPMLAGDLAGEEALTEFADLLS